MEDENEVLDWGNEDDEQLDAVARRSDADEDAVSLGDDDDEQEFYPYQRSPPSGPHPGHQGREPESRGRSPRPGSYQDYRSGHSRDRHREGSSSSYRRSARREPDSPQPHGTASYSPRRRSHSFSSHNAPARLTHALPPKPVVSTVPYLPSHNSVVEATAMSNRSRDSKKGNGAPSNGKTVSSTPGQETDLPLPPHWEARIPRNGRGIYYYNTLTEESTWDHPSDLTPKIAQEDDDMDPSRLQESVPTAAAANSSLSYQDRHYRPAGEPDAAPGNNRRPEGGVEGSNTQVFVSSTPPRSPRRARSLSPSQIESVPPPRIRDNGDSRPSRGGYRSGRGRPEAANFDPQSQRDRDIPSDAVYEHERGGRDRRGRPAPHEEGKDYREDGDRGPPRRQYRHQYPENLPFPGPPEDRDRQPARRGGGYTRGRERDPSNMIEPRESGRSQNQNLSIPTSRHRSPAPRMRDDSGYDDARQRQLPHSGASGPPGSMSRKGRSSRYDQPTDDGRPPTSIVPPTNASYSQPRDAEVDEPSYPRRPVDRDYDRSSRDSRDAAEGPPQRTHSSRAEAYVSRSRDDYREDTDIRPPPGRGHLSPTDDRGGPSRRRRGPLPPQESSFEEARKPPVGPDYLEGHHIPPVQQSRRPTMDAPLDSGAPEVPSGPRVRPPPLDTSFDRGRPPPGPGSAGYDRSRRGKWIDRRPSGNYEPTSPGDAMDVDRDQAPPRSGARFPPSPAVRSAEQRHPSSTFPDAADAPKGPRAMNKPYGGSGPSGPPEYSHGGGRPRERSPPPHMSGNRRREYDGGRPGHVWRERGYVQPTDRSGPPPFNREPRGRPPPPKPTTGTNDIPVGVRRRGVSVDAPRNFSPPRYENKFYSNRQASGGGPGAPRDLAPGKESYERPPHMDIAPPPPYRNNRYENAPGRDRPGDPVSSSSQPYSRRPPGPPPHGPSGTRPNRKSRFDTGGFDGRDQPMRSWGPHENSPPREHGSQFEREATPPPLSREPSAAATSPAWESAQGDQPPPVVEENIRSAQPARPMDVDVPVPPAPAPVTPVTVAPVIPVAAEAKVDRPPFPPMPFFGLPPPTVPMVKDIAKAKVDVPVPQVVPVPPPITTVAPVPADIPAQSAPSVALTSPADASGEKGRVSSETRRRSSRWGDATTSTNADTVPQPATEKEQETPARFERQPETQETYAPKSYTRRSFTHPQQSSNDENSGNSFNPSGYYSRDRDGSRYNRHEHQQQLSERIETQRPEMNRRGASLLERLDIPTDTHPQSLRDRVQIPSKRDRDDGGNYDDRLENPNEDDGGDYKRMKRRPGRMNHQTFNRRGGRRGGPP